MEETLAGSNSDVAKTILRGLRNFKMTFPCLHVREKPPTIPLSLCHIQ